MLLPAPLAPTSATVSPGSELEVERVEDEAGSRGVGERDPLEANGRVRRTGRDEPCPPPHRRGRLEQLEHALGDGQPVGARVELRAELAQRQVQLGREDEHGQPGLRPRPPSTSRTPTVTATSATPSVAASSSTDPERKATRSVPIVGRR